MKNIKIEVGDLVQLKGIWKNKVGIVLETETSKNGWYLIENHIDACHCIVDLKDVKLIKKQVIPKKYKNYLA
jgi:hypothetical protein